MTRSSRRQTPRNTQEFELLVKALNAGIDLLIAPFRWALGLFGYDMSAIDDVIRRVKRTFTFIISYPLEFAKRMIRGVGEGFEQFGKNIKSHLINTLVGWLTGALMDQPVVIPEKWNVSGILQFIGSLVGIGTEMVRGLIANLLPEEVIEQAENLLPVLMRIPEEGPGALWEYIKEEAEEMKRTAIEGVRDAVITQLAIIGVQKLLNVLTLGGSAFADAAKAFLKAFSDPAYPSDRSPLFQEQLEQNRRFGDKGLQHPERGS